MPKSVVLDDAQVRRNSLAGEHPLVPFVAAVIAAAPLIILWPSGATGGRLGSNRCEQC